MPTFTSTVEPTCYFANTFDAPPATHYPKSSDERAMSERGAGVQHLNRLCTVLKRLGDDGVYRATVRVRQTLYHGDVSNAGIVGPVLAEVAPKAKKPSWLQITYDAARALGRTWSYRQFLGKCAEIGNEHGMRHGQKSRLERYIAESTLPSSRKWLRHVRRHETDPFVAVSATNATVPFVRYAAFPDADAAAVIGTGMGPCLERPHTDLFYVADHNSGFHAAVFRVGRDESKTIKYHFLEVPREFRAAIYDRKLETVEGLAMSDAPEALVRLPDAVQEAGFQGLGEATADWPLGQVMLRGYVREVVRVRV